MAVPLPRLVAQWKNRLQNIERSGLKNMRVLIDTKQNAVAELHGFDAIITRNPNDFQSSNLEIITPVDFVARYF